MSASSAKLIDMKVKLYALYLLGSAFKVGLIERLAEPAKYPILMSFAF